MYTIREVTGYIKRDIEKSSDVDFGETGRKTISDWLDKYY